MKKEMADMVVIAIATEKDRILFEKIAFIQNKQEVFQKNKAGVQMGKRKWQIDQDQLFLLQNFPTFRVEGSAFPKRGYTLHNVYGKLGNYGLFLSPGEMVFANTKLVAAAQSDKDKKNNVKAVAKSEEVPLLFGKLRSISLLPVNQPCCFPLLSPCHYHDVNNRYWADCEEFFYLSRKLGYSFFQMPFLRSVDFTFNIYDFIRNWTMFGIGEPVTVFGEPLDPGLSHISDSLLQKIGLSFTRGTSYDERRFLNVGEEDRSVFGPGTVVFAVHYNISNE